MATSLSAQLGDSFHHPSITVLPRESVSQARIAAPTGVSILRRFGGLCSCEIREIRGHSPASSMGLPGHAGVVSSPSVRVQPLRPVIAPEAMADLRSRLSHSRLPNPVGDGWERGVPVSWLTDLVADWQAHDMAGLRPPRRTNTPVGH